MQTASVNYLSTLRKGVSLKGSARLTAEWNHNRFAGPVAIVNTGNVGTDTDEFPIESIVAPNRPQKDGILKGRATNSKNWAAAGKPTVEGYVQAAYDDSGIASGQRSYTVSSESKYLYWSSPTVSGTVLGGTGYDLSSGSLELTYAADIWVNKIVANFEASAVKPRDITVFYKTTSEGAWTQIAGTFQIDDASGQLVLYRQSGGTWSSTEYTLNPFVIRGIKIVVAKTNVPSANLNVIEISARLQTDLTPYIIDYSTDFTMSEPSLITPLGTCSSNQATVSLSNIDGRFDNDRANLRDSGLTNMFYGIIDKNIQMRMDVGIDVNGTTEWNRSFTMSVDEWGSQNEVDTSVTLKDSSKFLQEVKPTSSLYQGLTVAGIVWRLCDSVGFNNYTISANALNDNHFVDFYWTDNAKSVWEHFQDLAQSTQTAIYFDEFDQLQVLPRSAAYNLNNPVAWTFDGKAVPDGPAAGRPSTDTGKLPDIVELTETFDFEANVVNVKYIPTALPEKVGNIEPMDEVWAPTDDMVLRSSRLVTNAGMSDNWLKISPTDAAVWPYTGVFQLEGEFIRYKAKGYSYRLANGTFTTGWVSSLDQQKAFDAINPGLSWSNSYTGHLDCTGGRGIWGTSAAQHFVDINGWTFNRYRTKNGTVYNWNGGLVHNKDKGWLSMITNKNFTTNTWYVASRGGSGDAPPVFYGTRLKFPWVGNYYGAAGIAMSVGNNDSGYFVEIIRTKSMTADSRSKWSNELCFYVRKSDGSIVRYGPNGGKGLPLAINDQTWYDLDVRMQIDAGGKTFSIMVDGVTRMAVYVTNAQGTGEASSGRYGLFTRGFTAVDYEYFYSSTNAVEDTFDEPGWFDRINGGYQSSQLDREWTYSLRTATSLANKKKPVKYIQKYNSRLIDDFGPVAHEVREFDIKFDKYPVVYSDLYCTNDYQIICPEYNGNPFGAKFILANTARVNAIANGEDTLTFGSDNPVTQKTLIYGRLVTQSDEATVTVRNDAAVNRRGATEVDISSPWIQSKAAAQAIGDWITKHWGGGNDELKVVAIGNPLLQIGDIVAVNHPDKSMTYANNRYFIVGVSQSFDGGLETTFTLRRVKY